ncbi:MAG: chorismate mutase [Kiritimatiellae bacterium]|nr:chorismate mutase [Kiritimatiellia bacterium]
MELTDIRKEIDGIDDGMVRLFMRRMQLAAEVAAQKRGSGQAVLDPAREREILAKVARQVGPELENGARLLMTTLMSVSRGLQQSALARNSAFGDMLSKAAAEAPARFPSAASVACPGSEGGYAQQAVSSFVQFPSIFYFRDFDSVFAAVERGMCEYGVLPIENSAVGSVTQVYDLMAKHDFKIVKAAKLRVRHVLLAPAGVELDAVKEVWSHPHALAQCSEFLRSRPELRPVPAANTATAAEMLAQSGRRDAAVIASRECAALYGLEVKLDDISDTASNFTRFICISRRCEIYTDANKFSLMMSLPHRPGSLSDVLVRFSAVGVNLTKLESRPVPGSDFEFRFIFDFEASPRDDRVVKLLSSFANDPEIEHFTFLGAYSER